MEHLETMNDRLEMQEHGVVGEFFVFFPLYPPPSNYTSSIVLYFRLWGGGGGLRYINKKLGGYSGKDQVFHNLWRFLHLHNSFPNCSLSYLGRAFLNSSEDNVWIK